MSISSIVLMVISILLLFIGFCIKYLKFYFLIAGYNTANKEDKRLIDIKGLSKFMGNYFLIAGAAALVSMIAEYLQFYWALEIFIAFIILTLPYSLWKAQKYDKRITNYKENRTVCIVITVILFVFYSLIISLLVYGSQEQSISLSTDSINIGSPYSDTINLNDIKDISLRNSLPEIQSKINGIDGINHTEKGYFNISGLGEAKIYIHDNVSAYILITTNNGCYLINFNDAAKTKELYNEIVLKLHETDKK